MSEGILLRDLIARRGTEAAAELLVRAAGAESHPHLEPKALLRELLRSYDEARACELGSEIIAHLVEKYTGELVELGLESPGDAMLAVLGHIERALGLAS